MIKNFVPVEINGENYEIVVNVGAMLEVEKISGKNFMEVLKETETGNLTPTAIILSSTLKKDKKPVGIDFVKELSFADMQGLLNPLMKAIGLAFPDGDGKNE